MSAPQIDFIRKVMGPYLLLRFLVMPSPLLLASHPGYAIVPKSDEPQRIDDWGVNYQHLGIGPASEALQAKMHGEFLLSQHPATRDYVLDVPFATYAVHCEGEHGKLPLAVISWDDRSRNLDADAPRTFFVNADNSISPTKATHLAFGIRGHAQAQARAHQIMQGDEELQELGAQKLEQFEVV